ELVLGGLGELAAGALVDDALEELGAQLLVAAVAGLEQAEAEGVDRLVGDVALAGEAPGDREAFGGQARDLLEDRIVDVGGAQEALACGLQGEDSEEEALLVVDRGVDVGARAQEGSEAAEGLDWFSGLAQALGAIEEELDVPGGRDIGDELAQHALEDEL